MAISEGALVSCQKHLGANLRAVVSYHSKGFKRVFMRDDLGPESLEGRFDQWHDYLMISHLAVTDEKAEFPTELEMGIYYHSDLAIWIVHIPRSRHTGIVVTTEYDADLELETLQGACHEFIY